MQQTATGEPVAARPAGASDLPDSGAARSPGTIPPVAPQSAGARCGCGCGEGSDPGGAAKATYPCVYALGRVEPRFPTLAVEKEFAQATGRAGTAGLTNRQALRDVLAKRENRYLARQLCWVFSVAGVETYLLQPRDPADVSLLVDALRGTPRPTDLDVIIGVRGPVAPPQMCNGLLLPIVLFDQMYSFDVDALVKAIPRPEHIAADRFAPMAEEVFWRAAQVADNAGATDEHRALNYLTVRYDAVYAKAAECYGRNCALTDVEVRPSPLSAARKLVDVIFTFTHRETDVAEKHAVRVDVTEEFPFLVAKLSPFFEH